METNHPRLVGLRSSRNLGQIKVVKTAKTEREETATDDTSQTMKTSQKLKEEVFQNYGQVFTALGHLEKPYHIEIDPTVSPAINSPRTIPAALREKMKAELDNMGKRGVIRKVEERTDWVNSIAIVEKPDGSLHICLDLRDLNKAIKRDHFQLRTIEDITTLMASAKWLNKLNANPRY